MVIQNQQRRRARWEGKQLWGTKDLLFLVSPWDVPVDGRGALIFLPYLLRGYRACPQPALFPSWFCIIWPEWGKHCQPPNHSRVPCSWAGPDLVVGSKICSHRSLCKWTQTAVVTPMQCWGLTSFSDTQGFFWFSLCHAEMSLKQVKKKCHFYSTTKTSTQATSLVEGLN